MRRTRATATFAACAWAAVVLGVGGCQTEENVTIKRSMLAGLPGAEGGGGKVRRSAARATDATTPTSELRVEDERGNITLHARSARDVMVQVYTTIANGERELFVEQVLSERTKQEYAQRGLDPGQAFEELVERQREMLKLFGVLPYGEYTPGAVLENIGPNVFRLRAADGRARDLRWKFMDVSIERGEWRLRWFGP